YAPSSLHVYLNGHFNNPLTDEHDPTRNTRNIRAALKSFMDRWEGEQAEVIEFAHATADYRRIVDSCTKALEHGSAYVIDGPPGTQKTFSLRAAERAINARGDGARAIYVYARQDHAPMSLLREICNTAGIPNRGFIDHLVRKLRTFLGQGRILLIVDEAQHLAHAGLEILRQLLDLPPYFGVVLAGSHDLTQRLSHWQMEQWRSRVRKTLTLNGPSVAESREIIRAALGPHTEAQCDSLLAGCRAKASRTQHSESGKIAVRKFEYISARDLFFTIHGIQQQIAQRKAGAEASPRKETDA